MILEAWEGAIITHIAVAIRVARDGGKAVHIDRPYHGLVINEEGAEKDYCFSDGRVLHTEGSALFYLPKGSSYRVKACNEGRLNASCYAINFDAELADEPFAICFRNPAPLLKLFKEATVLFSERAPFAEMGIRKILYEIILRMKEEEERRYVPEAKERLLAPAMEHIHAHFTENGLTVGALAAMCGIGEVYFRRLFLAKHGRSPKEYIIDLRMEHAKRLLASGDLSVTEVALLSGYTEPCHFSREFTRQTGISPSRYRQATHAQMP